MQSSLESLQMQLKEINTKIEYLLFELMKNQSQTISLQDAAEILRLGYGCVYRRAVTEKRLEPDREIFLRRGKWFVAMSALNKLRTRIC